MTSVQNQEKQNGLAEEKNLAALGVLEEDDEFEEFAAEGLDGLKKNWSDSARLKKKK